MNPLAPRPMTPSEVADLVERTRENQRVAELAGLAGLAQSRPQIKVVAAAAQFAHDHGVSFAAAARRFGCSKSAVGQRHRKLFPGER